MLTTIPFTGFYCSIWSDGIDREEESYSENFAETQQDDTAPEMHLAQAEVANALFWAANYRVMHNAIARDYATAFLDWADETAGFPLRLKFESLSSPREYNFETDRIFCTIPQKSVRRLFGMSRREGHSRLADLIRERFTSRSGFWSFYPDDLASWLSKPLREWDHNEVGTLLLAVLGEPEQSDLYNRIDFYSVFEAGVDWADFDRRIGEARDDKLREWKERNPEADLPDPPYRCKLTPDLFVWAGTSA